MFDRTQIGALLHDEHLQTISTLQRLEEFLGRQGAKKSPDPAQPEVRKVLDSVLALAAEVERHFGFEEQELFTVMTAQGEMGMVGLLTEEHSVIRPLAAELAQVAKAAKSSGGFAPDDWRSFHSMGMELCEREIFHIQKEEMGLLAAISMLVEPEEDARLAEIYRNLPQHA